ncbi:hypothetical protein PSEUBRA_003735 [Kalmanozyma brasiliensis GHG001]|uniref:uncharacterized protein n=1 Tax=Kalmanozyma brasiliensis (strain GHG001) TaxID=1365824 RepID=UPI001CE962E7|nr:uncharacterized protein PSEUBRA_003735 [Kalmanozyma brasiliensis GHG001]EST06753.2 hypothetical protein PSEUBRA_003735 [Kalmanozyma brasiliensis GHG001]
MDPPPQPSTLPAEISTDAPSVVPISEAAPLAAEASQPLTSVASADEESVPAQPQSSAETTDAAVIGSIEAGTAPADPVLPQLPPATSELLAPAGEESTQVPIGGLDSTSEGTQDGTAATLQSTSGDQTVPVVPSTEDDAALPQETTESAEAQVSADTAQDTASAPIISSIEQPSSIEPTTAAISAPELDSTTVAPAAPPSSEDAPPASASEPQSAQSNQSADASASEQAAIAPAVNPSTEGASAQAVAGAEAAAMAPATEATSASSNTAAIEPVAQEAAVDEPAQSVAPDIASQSQADESAVATAQDVAASTIAEAEAVKSGSTATAAVESKDTEAKTDDKPAAATSSSDDVALVPAIETIAASEAAPTSMPATPEKRAPIDATSAAQPATSQPSTPAREGRVALILRINKELIRFCVDLQAKELTTDQVYREAAVRLQANLAYLASVADKAGKSVDPGARSAPSGALPRLEPFPRSEHAPSSPLPALYDKLIAIFGAAGQADSPVADGKKRSRDSTADPSGESPQKRTATKGVERPQDVSAAGTPSSSTSQPQPIVSATASTQPADATSTPAPAQPQQPAPAPQAASQQPQQPSQGPDLSLAPPVPIAPPTAAQNIPNNPQAQALMQAFGPNALVNLHALQSHLRGQGTHPWVAYMEANLNGFKAMPLQVQLQHMTTLQNAALQRQKAMQAGGDSSAATGSPAAMPNGGIGSTSSPAGTRPGSRHSNSPSQAQSSPTAAQFGGNAPGRTGTPLGGPAAMQKRPGSSGSVGSAGRNRTGSSNLAFDPSQLQSAPSPANVASATDFSAQQPNFGFQPPGLQQGSPAAGASPGQQPPQPQPGMMGMPNFQNLPPHLQQQIRQQYMAHMQAQAAQGQQPPGFNRP